MGLPKIGNGHQGGDGNLNEIAIFATRAPLAAAGTATLAVLQLLGGLLVANPSTTAATYTLPTVAALEAIVDNAKVGTTFELKIVNLGTGSGAVTVAVGAGWTLVGSPTIAITSSAQFRMRKTGADTWTIYRI
jgi:hypothetical protein